MDRISEQIRTRHGVLDIGTPAVRSLREAVYVLDSCVAFKWLVVEARNRQGWETSRRIPSQYL
jgi:hypothetical protein